MTIDNQRILQYGMYGLGAVIWYILYKFLAGVTGFILAFKELAQPDVPIFMTLDGLFGFLALAITAAAVEYVRRRPETNRFGIEVVTELRKVSWPNWLEVRGTTLVVLGVTFVVAGILWFFDSVYGALIKVVFRTG